MAWPEGADIFPKEMELFVWKNPMKPAWKITQKNQHYILNNHHVTHYLQSEAPVW